MAHFHAKYADYPRAVWVFGYDGQQRSLDLSRFELTKFEVFIYLYPGAQGCVRKPSTNVHSNDLGLNEADALIARARRSLDNVESLEAVPDASPLVTADGIFARSELAEMRKTLDERIDVAERARAKLWSDKIDKAGVTSDKILLRLSEAIDTEWNTYSDRLAAAQFLHQAVAHMSSGGDPPSGWLAVRDDGERQTVKRWHGGEVLLIVVNELSQDIYLEMNGKRWTGTLKAKHPEKLRVHDPDKLIFRYTDGGPAFSMTVSPIASICILFIARVVANVKA